MHKSRQPLRIWFEAVGLLYADSGISAAALGRKLGLTGPTACLMLKKIKLGLETGDRLLLGKMASLWGGVHLSPGKARTSSSEWL
jgi:hypothetical protein